MNQQSRIRFPHQVRPCCVTEHGLGFTNTNVPIFRRYQRKLLASWHFWHLDIFSLHLQTMLLILLAQPAVVCGELRPLMNYVDFNTTVRRGNCGRICGYSCLGCGNCNSELLTLCFDLALWLAEYPAGPFLFSADLWQSSQNILTRPDTKAQRFQCFLLLLFSNLFLVRNKALLTWPFT